MLSWCDALVWLQSVEGVVAGVLGVGLSWLIDYVPGFVGLAPRWKRLIILGLCLGVPLLSVLVAVWTGCFGVPSGDAIWQAVAAGAVAFSTSQIAHLPKLPESQPPTA